MKKRIAIITGATGGIGKEFVAQIYSEPIDEIWAVARNTDKLNELRQDYGDKIIAISLDLSNIEAVYKLKNMLEQKKPDIRYLVNNASLAKMGNYMDFTEEEIDCTINLNCKAPVLLSRICIPYMNEGSRIINISSASAFQPNPYINLYAASKVFERSYSRALNVELKGTGISSIAVCPSWVETDMLSYEKNGKKIKFPGIVSADRVVKKAIKDAKKGKDMSVCSFYVKCQHLYVKLMPQRFVMRLWMKGIREYI